MNLTTLMNKPLSEIVNEMQLADATIHNDNDGNIKCIELKYVSEMDNNQPFSGIGFR